MKFDDIWMKEIEEDLLEVKVKWDPGVTDKLRKLKGIWEPDKKVWVIDKVHKTEVENILYETFCWHSNLTEEDLIFIKFTFDEDYLHSPHCNLWMAGQKIIDLDLDRESCRVLIPMYDGEVSCRLNSKKEPCIKIESGSTFGLWAYRPALDNIMGYRNMTILKVGEEYFEYPNMYLIGRESEKLSRITKKLEALEEFLEHYESKTDQEVPDLILQERNKQRSLLEQREACADYLEMLKMGKKERRRVELVELIEGFKKHIKELEEELKTLS